MSNGDVLFDDFEKAKAQCHRWAPRSLEAMHALLVDGQRPSVVATLFNMTPQQVNTLRIRFLEKMKRATPVKVPAEQFMKTVAPAMPVTLATFTADLVRLHKNGYSDQQLVDFLQANDVQATTRQVSKLLRGN
jgi:hypothetical protein